jgi:hypothetical protein
MNINVKLGRVTPGPTMLRFLVSKEGNEFVFDTGGVTLRVRNIATMYQRADPRGGGYLLLVSDTKMKIGGYSVDYGGVPPDVIQPLVEVLKATFGVTDVEIDTEQYQNFDYS